MKILILGGNGMLGHKLVQTFEKSFEAWTTVRSTYDKVSAFEIFGKDRTIERVDASDFASVAGAIKLAKPDVVVNSIGIVKQKAASKNIEEMLSVNSIFPHKLALLGKQNGFRLITISTDCVFSGSKGNYSENDVADALDLYGQSKRWGEIDEPNCLTIRTSIIGRELLTNHGLVEWMISQKGKSVNGYAKAIFSGFPTTCFADIIVDIVENHQSLSGVYHVSSEPISKFELLNIINDTFKLGVEVKPFSDFEIDRSLDSTGFRNATGFSSQSWSKMIEKMAADTTPYDKWKNNKR
ncbi:MAG: dTDP-4-dehydrorhamnose reductase family protein [Pyrinomonadaceae bacterium]